MIGKEKRNGKWRIIESSIAITSLSALDFCENTIRPFPSGATPANQTTVFTFYGFNAHAPSPPFPTIAMGPRTLPFMT